jgi:hypothetical protein
MKIFYFQGMFVSRTGWGIGSYGPADELTEENNTFRGRGDKMGNEEFKNYPSGPSGHLPFLGRSCRMNL